MKYFVRAVKYFFYFAFLTSAIILALVFIGAVEGNIETIFNGGYSALWKIAIFFAMIAAVYPKVGFICRDIAADREWKDIREDVVEYFRDRRYVLESETADTVTFRFRDVAGRLSKMNEDRLTLKRTPEGYTLEGLRKDVIRLATGLEYRLNPHNED
jgi:hypothetical protein